MLQTIYIDVLFLINFSMDFLAVFITSYLLKMKLKTGRNTVSALIGALYSVLSVALRFDGIILALLVAFVMCRVAFGKRKIREFFYIFIAFVSVNFLLGGGMTALFSLFNTVIGERLVMIYGDVSSVPGKLPFNIFAIGVTLVTAIVMAFGKIFSRKGTAKAVRTQIFLNGKEGSFTLREDSGNMLTEPTSGDPVIFLSDSAIQRISDIKTLSAIQSLDAEIMKKSGLKMSFTVYETVSGKEMCVCIRPDRVLINGHAVRAWITSGKNTSFGEGDGIVPSVLISS